MINISTDPFELTVSNGVDVTIDHGFGHPIAGWVVVWASADIRFIADEAQDSRKSLVLTPIGSGFVRLVLL